MKISQSIKITFLILSFGSGVRSIGQSLTSLYTSRSNEKAREVMQDNEFERSEIGRAENIYCNPLILDGHPLDYANFTIHTRGVLALTMGNPASSRSAKIPFFIRLRRDGKILSNPNMDFLHKRLSGIEISTVLVFSLPGDHLIITPVNNVDWKAKRILKIVL